MLGLSLEAVVEGVVEASRRRVQHWEHRGTAHEGKEVGEEVRVSIYEVSAIGLGVPAAMS